MALSNPGKAFEVVDLTIDSDFDSDDDEVLFSHIPAVTSRANPAPSPSIAQSSKVSALPKPPSARPVPSPGSTSNTKQTQSVGAKINDIRTLAHGNTPANSSRPSSTTSPANMGRTASTSKSYGQAQTTPSGTVKAQRDIEPSAKRRKLSTPSGQEVGRNDTQTQPVGPLNGKQSSKPRHAATPAQSAPGSGRHTSRGVKLSTMNQMPSVHYMNAALKPGGSSIPFLDDVPTQAPRPLLIGRLSRDGVATDLPGPGLATPESMSAVTVDSDSLDVDDTEVVPPSPPVVKVNALKRQGHASGSGQTSQATSVQAKQSPPPSIPPSTPHVPDNETNGRDSVVSEIPIRGPTPQKRQQSPAPPRVPESTVPVDPVTNIPTNISMNVPTNKANSGSSGEAADHLLIFLKEVKKLKWKDITTEFAKDIPGRSYVQLQSRYSQTINKRDRTQDPPTLSLPPRFASEAMIDWDTIHAETAGSRVQTEIAGLSLTDALQRNRQQRAVQQLKDHEDSSGTELAPRQRSRRAAPVNYRVPGFRLTEGGTVEVVENDFTQDPTMDFAAPARSESPTNRTLVDSDTSTATRTEFKPMEMKHDATDAQLGLATQRSSRCARQELIPYLSLSQRQIINDEPTEWVWDQRSIKDWQGTVLHVDFSPAELQTVESILAKIAQPSWQTRHSTYRRHLRAILKGLTEPWLRQLAYEISQHLRSRSVQSIESFLDDASAGKVSDVPQIHRLAAVKPSPRLGSVQKSSMSTIVRQRELGIQSRRGWQAASTSLTYQTKNKLMDTLGPKSTWTGASSDIHTVAWSPDGHYFAAGAVAVTDTDSMQYNRPNNLMYGDTINGNIHELGEHYVDRPKTEAGANSIHAMFVSQDANLYTTVSSVAFSPSGNLMYSAGYDYSVCIWDIEAKSTQPQMARKLQHKAPVDVLAVNPHFGGTIATASQRTTGRSIKLVHFDEDELADDEFWEGGKTVVNFASAKAVSRPELKMTVNALQFSPSDGSLLLAGFGANLRDDNGLDTTGDICLWDVNTESTLQVHGSSRNVFDVTFNPSPRYHSLFAVGCVASGNVNRGTRSVVRFYNPKATKGESTVRYTSPLELECKAYDMNDIVWCPYDENLFAAGCTDGRSYVWDLRMPDRLLYTLSHRASLMPLQDDVPHERTDTGVRFLSWGQNATRLYSGSSDGVVKVWDVTRSQEDVFVKDLITTNSGIMSGAFTADYSKLALGEVNGTANVLEVGREDFSLHDADRLQYQPYWSTDDEDPADAMQMDATPPVTTDTAAVEARNLVETGQLRLAPMGGLPKRQVIQGPNYEGPFDQSGDAYTQSLREQAFLFQNRMAAPQGLQCHIATCLDSIDTITYEEVGDSGRSADRIPDQFRQQWLDESVRTVPGKSQCAVCSRPALPSLDTDRAALCERCSFTCFRCGWSNYTTGSATQLSCRSCAGVWSIGALGYECAAEPWSVGAPLDVPSLSKFAMESDLARLEDADTTFGDEMNALTDYYFALAIDRPESPLL